MRNSSGSLNILYVGTLPPHPGGGAISCAQLLCGLAKLGHTISALAPIASHNVGSIDSFESSHPEIRVVRFIVPEFHVDPNISPSGDFMRLERLGIQERLPTLIQTVRPDIILVGRGRFVLYVPEIAMTYSVPLVLRTAGATTIGVLKGIFPRKLSRQLLENYYKFNLIISPAKHLAERLKASHFGSVKVIRNAVNLRQFSPRKMDKSLIMELGIEGKTSVLHISNLKTLKRPMDLVYSAEKTLKKDPNLVYVVVGEGPYRQAMEEGCQEKGIFEKFRFIGWIDHSCIPDYINLADIVLMPSEEEAQARVYLETQACGRLIIASDIPGAREVIEHAETGLLFRMGDIEDMTAKILLAASDPELRNYIGSKALLRAKDYSIDDAVAAYSVAFNEVIRQTAQ